MFSVMLFVACAKLVQLLAVAVFSIWSHGAAKASLPSFFKRNFNPMGQVHSEPDQN